APLSPRPAFGLPAGSIRALLAFGVLGYLWVVVLRPGKDPGPLDKEASLAFIYLQFLMVLILGHFFTAHGRNIGSRVSQRSPLGLPTASVRLLLLAGYLGMAYYLWKTQVKFEIPDTGPVVLLLLVLATAFFVGHFLNKVMVVLGGGVLPAWFQDVQATFALVALLLLGAV